MPVLATSRDSKLSYTANPPTNGNPAAKHDLKSYKERVKRSYFSALLPEAIL